MQSHELLRDVIHKANPKEVSEQMGLSRSMIYKWAEPSGDGGSGTVNPLDRMEQLIKATGDARLAQ